MEKNYNPYKATVEAIMKMCEDYGSFETVSEDSRIRANDFLNNIRVKCKDAIEYEKMFPTRGGSVPTVKIPILNESLDRVANDYAEENMSEWWGGHSYVNDYDMIKDAVEFGANWKEEKCKDKILLLQDQIDSLQAARVAIKETVKNELDKIKNML